MEEEEEKTGTWSALRSAAKHFQLILSSVSKYSRSGEAPEDERPAHSSHSTKETPSTGNGCREQERRLPWRREHRHGVPCEAQIQGQPGTLRAAPNAQVHLSTSVHCALQEPNGEAKQHRNAAVEPGPHHSWGKRCCRPQRSSSVWPSTTPMGDQRAAPTHSVRTLRERQKRALMALPRTGR